MVGTATAFEQEDSDDLVLWNETGGEGSPFWHASADSSVSFSSVITLPSPPRTNRVRYHRTPTSVTARTPLNPRKSKKRQEATDTADLLFGPTDDLSSRAEYTDEKPKFSRNRKPSGLAGFFSGFMYEESIEHSEDEEEEEESLPLHIWNRLNQSLFLSQLLFSAATAVPVTVIPVLDFVNPSSFASTATAYAVLGTACGKFINGALADVFGARRVSTVFGILVAVSLWSLSLSHSPTTSAWSCFFVEFFVSVQWPCVIVILASHYNSSPPMYEGGIYITCLSTRLGALLAMPISSILLRSLYWRQVARCGSLVALAGCAAMFLLVKDAPGQRHCPQNPLRLSRAKRKTKISWFLSVVMSLVIETLLPSLKSVLRSGTFWIVAIAHTGGSMVRSSDKILGTYIYDTSNLSSSRASGFAVMLGFGIILGLGVSGSAFAKSSARQRKRLVSRLYILAIGACYFLAFLSIPKVRLYMPSSTVLLLQVVAIMAAGAGVAVQIFHIPGIVGATFGPNKGLYSAYTDGVAYGLASVVWRIVGSAVQEGNMRDGGGWAYGWAGVALLVILCAVLMVEFMEHYFCRDTRSGGKKDGYETIIFV